MHYSYCHKIYFELSLFFHGLQAVTVFFYVLSRKKPIQASGIMAARGSSANENFVALSWKSVNDVRFCQRLQFAETADMLQHCLFWFQLIFLSVANQNILPG